MNILVSACLLGVGCRYDGMEKPNDKVLNLMGKHTLIPVCPEQLGGMSTPRLPSERSGKQVKREDGEAVTAYYERGAKEALKLAQLYHCSCAILKERSPSCGKGQIYDGSFTHTLTVGDGVTTALLEASGIRVLGESQIMQVFGDRHLMQEDENA
ncbi:MAG: DUF523 domain-containing protein [Hungatella sp.]